MLAVAVESMLASEHPRACERELPRDRFGAIGDQRELRAKRVERLERGIAVDRAQFRGHR